jgi:hypothetical protein
MDGDDQMRALTVRPSSAASTQHVPLERWADALERRPDDVKVVADFAQ